MVGVSLLMPYLIAHQPSWPYGVMAGAMFGVAAVVGLFGPLTNNRSLEDVSPRAVG
jgi:hypothetical protein